MAILPVTLDGAELVGRAALGGGGTNSGGCSRPSNEDALTGVGNAGLVASLGLWAKTGGDHELRPSAWLRIKPSMVVLERRKRI